MLPWHISYSDDDSKYINFIIDLKTAESAMSYVCVTLRIQLFFAYIN